MLIEVERTMHKIKNTDIGLVNLLTVLLKLNSKASIKTDPKTGIAGISHEICKIDGITKRESVDFIRI
tara:strand:- start:356 stop:559 length:204 start_codon:yes stop_codon:yes gene_type:complete